MPNPLILITGGAGFIGSHLADELLGHGYRVRALDNLSPQVHGAPANGRGRPAYLADDVELVHGDVRDPAAVRDAAGAGACLITDAFVGVETFFEPGEEVLVAASGDEVAEHVRALTPQKARAIGQAALRRVLAEHTYDHRAALLEDVLAAPRGTGFQPVQLV